MNSSRELTSSYFDLFGLPVTYSVAAADLSERYKTLQKTVHPDKFSAATDQERLYSLQYSSRVNEAYQTLKSPLLRATYLLGLSGIDVN